MVCGRCEMAVTEEFVKMGLSIIKMQLGEVEIANNLNESQIQLMSKNLNLLGFELLNDKVNNTVERIKNLIFDLVHNKRDHLKSNLSSYLSAELRQDYSTLSKLFSEKEGVTIEHYFIAQKIDLAKELLIYSEMTLSEIAIQLNYSNVAHLSNQFKKTTGFTSSHFKQLKVKKKKQIGEL